MPECKFCSLHRELLPINSTHPQFYRDSQEPKPIEGIGYCAGCFSVLRFNSAGYQTKFCFEALNGDYSSDTTGSLDGFFN